MSLSKILLVDDEAFFFELISELLGNSYEFEYAESGKACIEKATTFKPDIILLDVQMPGMDGYETCKALKQNQNTHNTPVFFVSGNDSIEEKIKGYDAGGDDYIVKPLDGLEIDRKITTFLERHNEHLNQYKALKLATSTAKTALCSQGEQGVIISYLTYSYLCHDIDSLANQLLTALNNFGYYAIVRLSSHLTSVTRNTNFKWNPIEESILDQLISNKRITETEVWVLFNSSNVQVLLKKDPNNPNEEKLGRVRDHVTVLMQGTEARIQNLIIEQGLDEQTTKLFNIVKSTRRKLEYFSAQKTAARRSIADSIDEFYIEFENNLAEIGLTENQEKDVVAATDQLINLMIDICSDKLNDHAVLNNLLSGLNKMVNDAK